MTTSAPLTQDELKTLVGQAALQYVAPGEIVGVGTGSTVNKFIDALATIKQQIKGAVSSSVASTERLQALGIPVYDANDVEGLAVYIAGPMTGLPRWNYDAFEEAAWRLRAHGAIVTSPHEMDIAAGFDPDNVTAGKKFDLQAALDADVAVVEASDLVVLLPGWEDSPGAIVEVMTAEAAVLSEIA